MSSVDSSDLIRIVLKFRKALREEERSVQREKQWNEFVVALETLVEQGPDVYQEELRTPEDHMLQEISMARHELVKLDPTCEERWLDWAIASKRARNMNDCVLAHKKRMDLVPRYKTIDAVRLLGLSDNGRTIQEVLPSTGLFELLDSPTNEFRPSSLANDTGKRLRSIFYKHGYTLSNCTAILASVLHESVKNGRLFSANSFFHHRHDLDSDCTTMMTGLDVLARLFLFGLAFPLEVVQDTIGNESVKVLFEAGLICTSQADPGDVVGEVQVYPISPTDLFVEDSDTDCTYWFMTDWPMESLRSTRDAVMSVGYDTLELMSLSVAVKPLEDGRLLDLCCGSGIQGIFALLCNRANFRELVCSDVNERACRFAAANMALNIRHENLRYCVTRGDLYENVKGTFECILSNPPFVAIPSRVVSVQTAPALYTVGGGPDGMALLRRVVNESPQYLNGTDAALLVVTELPNIESSCHLICSFLPEDTKASIRIAYVGADVESVEEYATVRQREALSGDRETRDWASEQLNIGCINRALALMCIRLGVTGSDGETMLYQYGDRVVEGTEEGAAIASDAVDEEDAFLTLDGIQFTRNCLL